MKIPSFLLQNSVLDQSSKWNNMQMQCTIIFHSRIYQGVLHEYCWSIAFVSDGYIVNNMKNINLISEDVYLNVIGIQSTKAKGIPLSSISQLSGKTRGTVWLWEWRKWLIIILCLNSGSQLGAICTPRDIFWAISINIFGVTTRERGGATGI